MANTYQISVIDGRGPSLREFPDEIMHYESQTYPRIGETIDLPDGTALPISAVEDDQTADGVVTVIVGGPAQ
ncbi:MAG: hypothetical protein JO147_10935 [Actinobacteria bacterium]|nr:hypothetical protein [Actinomycetota bacterium]